MQMKQNTKAEEEELLINENSTSFLMGNNTPSKYLPQKWYDSWSNLNCTLFLKIVMVRWIYFLGNSLYARFVKEYCGSFSFETIILLYW